jgi:hypothetical protein
LAEAVYGTPSGSAVATGLLRGVPAAARTATPMLTATEVGPYAEQQVQGLLGGRYP